MNSNRRTIVQVIEENGEEIFDLLSFVLDPAISDDDDDISVDEMYVMKIFDRKRRGEK